MKKYVTILLAAVFVVQLCGCVIDRDENLDSDQPETSSEDSQESSEDQQENGQVELPENENSSAPETDSDAKPQQDEEGNETVNPGTTNNSADEPQTSGGENGDVENSGEDIPVDTWTDEQIVQAYLNQHDTWDAHALLDEMEMPGYYKTGYAFFDIDLDGNKELAVQLGGGTMQNCKTEFYRLDETGTVVRYEEVDSVFSLAVENLLLVEKADGTKMYLMHYTLRPNVTEYWEYWAELLPQEGQNTYQESVQFTKVTAYTEEGLETYTYYIGNDVTDAEAYTAAYTAYMAELTVTTPQYQMIAYSDWTSMDDLARTKALLESLRA